MNKNIKMKTFEEVKADMLDRAKKTGACKDGYKMGMNALSKADLLKAVTDNWCWVLQISKMIDVAYLEENFTEEELIAASIYTRKEHRVSEMAFACGSAMAFACGSATVEAYGYATVEAYDYATVEAYDYATVEAYDSAKVEAYDSSKVEACGSAKVEACDSATVKACDSATVKAYGSATVEAHDSAKVEAYGSAKVEAYGYVTVEAYGYSYVEDFTGNNIRPKSDYAIVKDCYKHKIYIKKGSFKIIEVE